MLSAGAGWWTLLATTFLYGLRHGIDWDHIAAITDITGASGGEDQTGVRRDAAKLLFLATLYALGHAAMVGLLGTAALFAHALLPVWVDPILERVVGGTLLLLGVWVFYSLVQFLRGRGEFRLRSRWMLLFAGISTLWHRLHERLEGKAHEHEHRIRQYGPVSAFLVGLIHGIGAETGSQVLLIAAVGGTGDPGRGVLLMLSFILGLVLSNTAIAVASTAGFLGAQRHRGIYVAVGVATGLFSLVVGAYFVLGRSGALPDLRRLLGAGAG